MKDNGEFVGIPGRELQEVLRRQVRQYLAGNLKRPQDLPFVRDERLEIGVTSYGEQTGEPPHWHSVQREYQYVLSGTTRYQEAIRGAEHVYDAGDFYAILPEICYTQDSAPGTTILFVAARFGVPLRSDCRVARRRRGIQHLWTLPEG